MAIFREFREFVKGVREPRARIAATKRRRRYSGWHKAGGASRDPSWWNKWREGAVTPEWKGEHCAKRMESERFSSEASPD